VVTASQGLGGGLRAWASSGPLSLGTPASFVDVDTARGLDRWKPRAFSVLRCDTGDRGRARAPLCDFSESAGKKSGEDGDCHLPGDGFVSLSPEAPVSAGRGLDGQTGRQTDRRESFLFWHRAPASCGLEAVLIFIFCFYFAGMELRCRVLCGPIKV
jgi:hypothetical protein